HSVVVRSTVPPGTVDEVVAPVLRRHLAEVAVDTAVAMCPEFLREGSGIADFFSPPYIVLGTSDDRVAATMRELFAFVEEPVRMVDVRSAEALKYACNAFHATKV